MSDHEEIRSIKRHFGNEITREIRPSTVKTISEMTALLNKMEYERKLMKLNRKSAEENQSGARKLYENRQRTKGFKENLVKKFNEPYIRDTAITRATDKEKVG